MHNGLKMASLLDFRDYAQHTLAHRVFEALDDGAGDQVTKGLNTTDFVKIKLKQRGMANMKYFKGTQTRVLGGRHEVQTPIGLGPLPLQQTYHYDGECASALAARELGIPYTLDVRSSYPVEQIISLSNDV